MCVCVFECVYMSVYMSVCVCVCVYVCVCAIYRLYLLVVEMSRVG